MKKKILRNSMKKAVNVMLGIILFFVLFGGLGMFLIEYFNISPILAAIAATAPIGLILLFTCIVIQIHTDEELRRMR